MALKLSNGIYVSASAVGGSMLKDWFLVEANYTAKNRDAILAKSSGGSFNITLPLAPSVGDSIAIAPALPTYVTNPVTVLRNGQLIAGSANDLLLNSNNISIELCFVGGTVGWGIVDCGMVSVINLGPGVNTVTAGANISVDNTDPSNPIISSTGGSFDPTANQTITGEWKFDVSGGKSWLVSDDPTLVSFTKFLGVVDHVAGFNDTNTLVGYSFYDPTGTYGALSYSVVNDDSSVADYHSHLMNANGSAGDSTLLLPNGTSKRTTGVDEWNIASSMKIDIGGGKSFIVSDDITFASPTNYFGIFDHSVAATAVFGAFGVTNTTNSSSGHYQVHLNDDGSVIRYLNVSNSSGAAVDGTSIDVAGVSIRAISVDTLNIDAEVNVDISGGKSFIVSDDPTLSAPPTKFLGLVDHSGIYDTSTVAGFVDANPVGANSVVDYTRCNDDGSVIAYHRLINDNDNGNIDDITVLNIDGTSSRSITVDDLTIDSNVKIDVSGGKSFIVSDDPTLGSQTSIFGLFDHVVGYNDTSVEYRVYRMIGTALFDSALSLSDDNSSLAYTGLSNNNGSYTDATYLNTDGSSERDIYVSDLAIHADTITLTGETVLSMDPTTALGAANKQYVDYITINEQSGTSYTVLASDNGKVIRFTNGSPINLTINSDVSLLGFNFVIEQAGAGQVTFIGTSTRVNADGHTKTFGQYSTVSFMCTTAGTFNFGGRTA